MLISFLYREIIEELVSQCNDEITKIICLVILETDIFKSNLRSFKFYVTLGVILGRCQPYGVPPCLRDGHGNSSCSGRPAEKNHRCYENQNLNFKKDLKCD